MALLLRDRVLIMGNWGKRWQKFLEVADGTTALDTTLLVVYSMGPEHEAPTLLHLVTVTPGSGRGDRSLGSCARADLSALRAASTGTWPPVHRAPVGSGSNARAHRDRFQSEAGGGYRRELTAELPEAPADLALSLGHASLRWGMGALDRAMRMGTKGDSMLKRFFLHLGPCWAVPSTHSLLA